MILSAVLHIIFSEDILYCKKGNYGRFKFFHNVMMNSFACIYFHNYLRFEEDEIEDLLDKSEVVAPNEKRKKPPRTHITTFLRQFMFETLYVLEFFILLPIGFSANWRSDFRNFSQRAKVQKVTYFNVPRFHLYYHYL